MSRFASPALDKKLINIFLFNDLFFLVNLLWVLSGFHTKATSSFLAWDHYFIPEFESITVKKSRLLCKIQNLTQGVLLDSYLIE